ISSRFSEFKGDHLALPNGFYTEEQLKQKSNRFDSDISSGEFIPGRLLLSRACFRFSSITKFIYVNYIYNLSKKAATFTSATTISTALPPFAFLTHRRLCDVSPAYNPSSDPVDNGIVGKRIHGLSNHLGNAYSPKSRMEPRSVTPMMWLVTGYRKLLPWVRIPPPPGTAAMRRGIRWRCTRRRVKR